MHNIIVNKTRYDDLVKPMKQTSFIVKKPRGKPSRKANHSELFYRFGTSELFNI